MGARDEAVQKELRRKEKALAETAALLVLQKKSKFCWRTRTKARTPNHKTMIEERLVPSQAFLYAHINVGKAP